MPRICLVLATATNETVEFLSHCYTTPEIRGWFQPCRQVSPKDIREEVGTADAKRKLTFLVKEDGLPIGYAYARYVSALNHHEIGVTLTPSARGRGIGSATHQLLVNRLFGEYQARQLIAYVSTRNEAEKKALLHCGFRLEKTLRQAGRIGNEWHDLAIYGLLATEPPS